MGLHHAKKPPSPYRRIIAGLAVLAVLNVLIWTAAYFHG